MATPLDGLPAGFVLDEPESADIGLPPGFVLDSEPQSSAQVSGGQQQGFVERWITNPLGRGKNQSLDPALDVGLFLAGQTTPEEFAQGIISNYQEAQAYPRDPRDEAAMREFQKASEGDSWWDPIMAAVKNPSVAGQTIVESIPGSLASAGGALAGGVAGGAGGSVVPGPGTAVGAALGVAAGAGATSGYIEFSNSLVEAITDTGKPLTQKNVLAAINDPEVMALARDKALKRGMAVGAFDAISGGVAGRLMKPVSKLAGGGKPGRVIGAGTEVAAQGGLGAGGEATAQIATDGQITNKGDVVLEGVAEFGTGAIDIGGAVLGRETPQQLFPDQTVNRQGMGDLPRREPSLFPGRTPAPPPGFQLDDEQEAPARPPQQTRPRQLEDDAYLMGAGWTPEQIADMNPDERRMAAEEARAQGVEPVDPFAGAPEPETAPRAPRATAGPSEAVQPVQNDLNDADASIPQRPTPGPGIWANAEADFPITILDEEPLQGDDGRWYQPVDAGDGPRYVPLDEIRPAPRGTRTSKQPVQTPEDLEAVRPTVNAEPTPAQAQAGNYQKGHIRIHGMDVSIENPKGSIRRSKDPSNPWESPELPADYGYIKGTSGRDGDQVDVYIGPNPASDRVFVIDQMDLKTGKFDEHKAVLGAAELGEAVDLYVNSFDDPTLDRIGDVTEMSVDEFRQWVKDGKNTKRPAAKAGIGTVTPNTPEPAAEISAPPPADVQLNGGEAATALDEAFADVYGQGPSPEVAPAPAPDRSGYKDVKLRKPRNLKGPIDGLTFIAMIGGIKDPTGELRAMDLHKVMTRAGPVLRNKTGLHPDKVREELIQGGYIRDKGWGTEFQQETTLGDIYEFIRRSMFEKTYSERDQAEADAIAATKAAENQNPELEELAGRHPIEAEYGAEVWQQIESFFAESGTTEDMWSVQEVLDAAEMVATGMDASSAFERAAIMQIERDPDEGDLAPEITAAFERGDANAMVAFDVPPFPDVETETDAVQQQGSPEEGDGLQKDGEAGERPDGEGAIANAAEEVRGPGTDGTEAGSAERAANEGVAEQGPFGPIFYGHDGRWRDAALRLEDAQTGEAPGALSHPDVGPIALVWGEEGSSRSDGYGLAKILAWHPEVLEDLQGAIDRMEVTSRSENRIQLASKEDRAAVRLDWDGQQSVWLISAFKKTAPRRTEKFTGSLSDLWAGLAQPDRRGDEDIVQPYAADNATPTVEPGAEGKPQLVIPGAEQDVKGAMQNAASKPLKGKAGQKDMDIGLFGSERDQTDLFDAPKPNSASAKPNSVSERAARIKDKLVIFSSGMSRLKDFVSGAYTTGGLQTRGIGIDVQETNDVSVAEMAKKVVDWQTQVFIDSGAFGVFKRNLKERQRYEAAVNDLFEKENATPPKLEQLSDKQLLKKYDAILMALSKASEDEAEAGYPQPLFVAPDIVGDQQGSIELVRKNATWLKRHLAAGRKVIIPIQKGGVSLAEAFRAVEEILGRNDFVVGVPSNQKAVSDAEFAEFVAAARPSKIHFLGTTDEKKLQPRIEAIAEAGYEPDHISSDANMLRALLYGRSDIEETRDQGIRRVIRERSPEFEAEVRGPASDAAAALDEAFDDVFGAGEQAAATQAFDPAAHVLIAADSIARLRASDVERLFEEAPKTAETFDDLRVYIIENRPDLAAAVMDAIDAVGMPKRPSTVSDADRADYKAENKAAAQRLYDHVAAGNKVQIPLGRRTLAISRSDQIRVGSDGLYVQSGKKWDYIVPQAVEAALASVPKTAGQAAASAVKNVGMSIEDAAKGLNALFGGKNKLSSGFTFDEGDYEKAKPFFRAAVAHLGEAAKDMKDLALALVRALANAGLNREAAQNMRPYLLRFMEDVRAGKIALGEEPAAEPQQEGKFHPIVNAFVDYLSQPDAAFDTITEARKFAADRGFKVQPGTPEAKQLDEMLELAIVLTARTLVAASKSRPVATAYRRLVDLYRRQPNLGVRTSESMADQAYSTPAPLAYIASRLAGVAGAKSVLEPTAGNGMLLIEASPGKAAVNEINDRRAEALTAQGFRPTRKDAASENLRHAGYPVDSIIANPPFGAVKEADGSSKVFTFENWNTTQIDHVIALRALQNLKDDGRAVLIVGSVKEGSDKSRSDSYNTKQKREFYWRLYQGYNVTDHFTVAGDLYKRQGAGWPVDVIVIEGKGKSARPLPAVELPKIYDTWESLEEKLNEAPAQAQAGTRPTVGGNAVSGPSDVGNVGEDGGRLEAGSGGNRAPSQAGRPSGRNPATEPEGGVPGGRDQREPGNAGQQQSSEPDNGAVSPGTRTDGDGDRKPAAPVRERLTQEAGSAQQPYQPMSGQKSLDTKIPTNMADAVQTSLEDLADRYGDLDAWLEKELGYKKGEIGKYLAAEQVDAVALAIDNVKKNAAFIIGDQTGIGKGRVVASALRYAMRQGLTPIFVTEKPNLYGDMIRDLNDIGVPEMLGRDVKPFLTNAGASIPLDDEAVAWFEEAEKAKVEGTPAPPKRGKFLRASGGDLHKRQMAALQAGGKDFDIVFTTYDQMNTVKGQTTDRRRLMDGIADRAFIVLDESHNAGGTEASGWQKDDAPENRSDFLKRVLGKAKAVMFSSATYAKRPGVMALYARTDMGKAVESPDMLGELISKGGVPMQQVVAAMLAKAGQYIRRERSFDGVSYDVQPVAVDAGAYDAVSTSIATIARFDMELKKSEVWDEIKENLKEQAEAIAMDSGTGEVSVSSTNFTSLMHNIVNQMLLAIKTDAVADLAIEALKNGEKPVITVSNTMGAFLKTFAEDNDIKRGDPVSLSFRNVLQRYLERTRRLTIKRPDGTKYHYTIPLSALPGYMQKAYADAEQMVDNIDTTNLPISPIDWLHHRLRKAGYRTAEITGRKETLEYGGPDDATFAERLDSEISPGGRRVNIDKFNRGALDVMILNRAGSTGLSLHSSSKFKDQRRRRMIIAQAEGNIDVHMQMLGRVHRTGQVIPPAFVQAYADVPAEARPAAVLAKKMASLNANTTASRKSAFSADDSVDFLNEYGDQIAREYLRENPEIGEMLNVKVSDEAETARELTGRLLLLPVEEQRRTLDEIGARYTALIANLDAMGENALEAKTMDLAAKTVGRQELKPAEGESPFTQAVILEEVEVKSVGRALPLPEILTKAAESLGIKNLDTSNPTSALNELERTAGKVMMDGRYKSFLADFDRMAADEIKATKSEDVKAKRREAHQENRSRFTSITQFVVPGYRVVVRTKDGEPMTGIVMAVSRRGQTGATGNPLALGAWSAEIAIPDNAQRIIVPFSSVAMPQDNVPEGQRRIFLSAPDWSMGIPQTVDMFDKARQTGKETRHIVTGNILAGFDQTNGRGQIVNYTDDQGNVKPGILMARTFDPASFMSERAVRFKTAAQVMEFLKQLPAAEIVSHDNVITVRKADDFTEIELPSSRQTGGTYFLNPEVRRAARDQFTKVGSRMRYRARTEAEARAVLDAMMGAGAVFQTTENQEAAEAIINGGRPQAPLSSRTQGRLASRGADATFAAEFMMELAGTDELFRYPVVDSASLERILAGIAPEVESLGRFMLSEADRQNGAFKKTRFRDADGYEFFVLEDRDGQVWLDISGYAPGQGGAAIYSALGNYAYNSGKVFIGDPAGLSDDALRRRTEAMLSSALKSGSTRHIEPHPRQLQGAPEIGIPPLKWTYGDDFGNIASLIEASTANTLNAVPELANVRFDFGSRTFRTAAGGTLSDEMLDGWISSARRVREARTGRATAKRAVLLNSLLRAPGGERPGLLALVLRQSRELVRRGGLSGLLYSSTAPQKPIFYSALLRAVEGMKQTTGTKAQWMGMIRNAPGVKPEEIKWIGLEDYLLERPGGNRPTPVTKQELVDFIKANQVEVTEVVKRQPDKAALDAEIERLVDEEYDRQVAEQIEAAEDVDGGPDVYFSVEEMQDDHGNTYWAVTDGRDEIDQYDTEAEAAAEAERLTLNAEDEHARHLRGRAEDSVDRDRIEQRIRRDFEPDDQTKFSQYQLPGGESYRELLLTLPTKDRLPPGFKTFQDREAPYKWGIEFPDGVRLGGWDTEEKAIASQRRQAGNPTYTSSHWDEPNILAHIRFNERTDADGKRVLFIEEIQSDWAQSKRKGNAVPDAPLIGSTNDWASLAMKRMIRWAAENGFDRVAWTPGEVQAERYDLSREVESITWATSEIGKRVVIDMRKSGTFAFQLSNDGTVNPASSHPFAEQFNGKSIDEVVGKDIGEKIVNSKKGSLSGEGLKVGGKGMRGFYDKILVDTANKLGKKWGTKVYRDDLGVGWYERDEYGEISMVQYPDGRWTSVSGYSDSRVADDVEAEGFDFSKFSEGKPTAFHSLDITPEMARAAMEGQPLFSKGKKPVASLTGRELMDFTGPQDMPALRQAATRWYDQNLRGTTATTKDGVTVRFTRKGMGKSTSAGKGDILLRSVPAIRSIIESGEVVLREPGNRPGIMERLVISAPVRIAGTVRQLAVSVHRVPDGSYQYDLTYDRNVDGKKPGVNSGGLAQLSPPLPSLEVPLLAADGLNLFEVSGEIKAPRQPQPEAPGIPPSRSNPYRFIITQKQKAKLTADLNAIAQRILGRNLSNVVLISDQREWERRFGSEEDAIYDPNTGIIYLALQGSQNPLSTLRHEAIHALRQAGVITAQEWAVLSRMARTRWIDQYDIRARYEALYRDRFDITPAELEELLIEEAVADAMADQWNAEPTEDVIGRIRTRIKAFLDAVRNMLRGQGFTTAGQIMQRIESGQVAQRAPGSGQDRGFLLYERQEQGQARLASRGRQPPPRNPAPGSFDAPHDERVRRALFDSTDTILNRIRRAGKGMAVEGLRKLQDREIDLLRTQMAIEDASGPISEPKNAYLAASLYPGRVAQRDENLVEDFIEPLVADIASRGLTLEEVDEFNMARHAFERNIETGKIAKPGTQFHEAMTNPAIVGGSGLSDNEASDILSRFQAQGKYADLKAVGDQIVDLNRRTLTSLYNEGLITQEQFDALTQKYQYYVPLRGFDDVTDESNPDSPRAGRRYDVRGKEFQQAFGRTSVADSPLAYSIMQARQALIRIEKNRVGKRLLRLAQANPNEEFWQINRVELKKIIDKNTGYVRNVFDRGAQEAENVYAVKVGGKRYNITLHHEGLLRAMKGIGGENMHGAFAFLHRITRFLAAVRTQYNPEFIFTNFLRDLQQSGIVLSEENVAGIKRKVLGNLPKAMAGMNRMLNGDLSTPWARYAREFADAGGKIGFMERIDIEGEKRALEAMMKDANPSLGRKAWLKFMEHTLERIDRYNDVVENTMRLSAYVAMRQAGASQDRAASVARELTVNFNRKGEWGPHMNALFMFFNASTQGAANFSLRLYRSPKLRAIAGGLIVYGFLQSMLNRMLGGDDDDEENRWNKIPMNEKQRNHIIMLPKALEEYFGVPYFKIPAPLSWNLPMIIGMQVEHGIFGDLSPLETGSNILGAFGDAFNPLGSGGSWANFITPTIGDPVVDIAQNRNFFGDQITPRQFDETTPFAERHSPNVNPYAKWITDTLSSMTGGSPERAGAIDWSPEWVEHIFDFTFGGVGALFSRTSTTVDAIRKGEEVDATKVPFARTFVGRDSRYTDRDQYFQIRDAVHVTEKELEARMAEGNREAAERVRKQRAREVQMIPFMNSAEKRLARLRKDYKAVKNHLKMGEETKKQRLERIRQEMDDIQLKVRTRWNRLEMVGKTVTGIGAN